MVAPDTGPTFLSLRDAESLAKLALPRMAYDYVAGGGGEEVTLAENARAYDRWRLLPRVLRDVGKRDLSTTALGARVDFPVLLAPTAFHRLVDPGGEAATARAAAAAGTLMVASTLSTTPLEDVAAASGAPKWFQLYIYKDRELTRSLVQRAKRAGYAAIVLTVDTAVWGRRERDVRNGFSLPPPLGLANFRHVDQRLLPHLGAGADGLAAYVASQLDPSVTWRDVEWLREVSGLPVLVKGLVSPDDARLAVAHGCAGVVVSNHGGRQLDRGIATLDALPGVVEAVGGRAEVYVDGGVRRGTDVLVALALGARAVLVGRPVLWGLALGGERGAQRALGILRDELDSAMALCGVSRVEEIDRDLLVRTPS